MNALGWWRLGSLCLLLGCLVGELDAREPAEVSAADTPDWNRAQTWIKDELLGGRNFPFTFQYDGVSSPQKNREDWTVTLSSSSLDDRTLHVLRYRHNKTGLEVRCHATVFKKYPAVEWVLRFRNRGEKTTPILSEIHALKARFVSSKGYNLRYASGAGEGVSARATDFGPREKELSGGSDLRFAPLFGRPSWGESLPFFNLDMGSRGVFVGLGWTGQWQARFGNDRKSAYVRAGMEGTHLKLYPGEEIRTPRVLLVFWKGHWAHGQNLWRRVVLDHIHPQKNGRPRTMPFLTSSAAVYEEAFNATEANQVEFARKFANLGLEYIWLDVGWHDASVGHTHLGPIDLKRFPGGFRSLTDKLREFDMGLLVWMAPEFQGGSSWMEKAYPELYLKLKDKEVDPDHPLFRILNFGDRDALKLITDNAVTMVEEGGIGIYRMDGPIGANLKYPEKHPLRWWRDQDAPDRQGITEIRYVEGLYSFWDKLRRRNPDLVIDLCGGGATRIDLEAMSRCMYLWRSDYNHPGFEPDGHQSMTYGLTPWVPSTGTASGYPDTYSFRSSVTNGLALAWNPYQPEKPQRWPLAFPVEQESPHELKKVVRKTVDGVEREGFMVSEPFPWDRARRLIAEFLSVRDFFQGDFYPLTPYSLDKDCWMAYQLHRPDRREGIVLAFRRAESSVESMSLGLWGLTPDARYELHFEDEGRKENFKGRDLTTGLGVRIEKPRGSRLIRYRRLEK